MARVPDQDRRDDDEGDQRRQIGRRTREPRALAGRQRDEGDESERRQHGVVFRQAGEAEPQAGGEPQAEGGARRGASKNSRASVAAAPASAKSSGPSGTTQVPAEAKKNGVRLSATSAIRPARAPNRRRVSANVSQPVAANSATNGSRVAAPSPSASAAKWAIH